MAKYTLKRILSIIPSVFIVGFIVFCAARYMPGMQNLMNRYEPYFNPYNENIFIQYLRYLGSFIQGDWGFTLRTNRPVLSEIMKAYPLTLILAFYGALFSTALGFILGIVAAVNRNKFIDNLIMILSLLTASVPLFFMSLILMLVFTVKLGLLPSIASSTVSFRNYFMPVMALGLPAVGYITRVTRQAMAESLNQDYIRTSMARGIPDRIIIFSHALKNAVIPVITAVGIRFGELLVGTVLVENAFSIPGLGRLLITAINDRDYYCMMGCIIVLATTFLIINVIIDLIYSIADPRIKLD